MSAGKKGWKDLIARAPRSADVLIVEDEPSVRRLTRDVVEGLGYSVKTVASAEGWRIRGWDRPPLIWCSSTSSSRG